MNQWDALQEAACERVMTAFRSGQSRICFTGPTGCGKSKMTRSIIGNFSKQSVYSHRKALIQQLSKSFKEDGIEHGIRASGHEDMRHLDVQISSIQTELKRQERWELHNAGIIVPDECFVGNTMIMTTTGPRRIDSMRCGDTVYCATGLGSVIGVSCRPAQSFYIVELSDGSSLECTGSHPILTCRGWIEAAELAEGEITFGVETMRVLWGDVEAVEEVRRRWPTSDRYARKVLESSAMLRAILCKEAGKSDEQESGTSEDEGDAEKNPPQTDQAWRERAIATFVAVGPIARTRGWLGSGICDSNKDAESERLPVILQGGYRRAKRDDRRGDRRKVSRHKREEVSGREEAILAGVARVVRVSFIERKSLTPVFNLRVEGHPSYFANGRLVHNCHLQKSPAMVKLFNKHVEMGGVLMGPTATPVGIGHLYDTLISAGTVSEFQNCGAIVRARCFEHAIPDPAKCWTNGEDMSPREVTKILKTKPLFGRVIKELRLLNPLLKPSILFAPGVAESKWFAEQLIAQGIPAAHIDGECIILNGQEMPTNDDTRERLAMASLSGEVKVVTCRFVLREGVDWPWIQYLSLATIIGALESLIQMCGRGLRSFEGKTEVICSDHGGNFRRHKVSPNTNIEWKLDWENKDYAQASRKQTEPFRCPACAKLLLSKNCSCGFVIERPSRMVIQTDDRLVEVFDEDLTANPKEFDPQKAWDGLYYMAKNSKRDMVFRALKKMYFDKYGHWPPPLKNMPTDDVCWGRFVKDVPRSDLRVAQETQSERS